MTRIALIHALSESIAPVNEEMRRAWPECDCINLLDDSLSVDRARSPTGLDASMTERFVRLAEYAVNAGSDGLLFTCSAFGPCIEEVARRFPSVPVLKPGEAMIAEATALFGRVGLVATFQPTLVSMPGEFPSSVEVRTSLAEGAMSALQDGNAALHDELVVAAALRLAAQGCAIIALAQFSMARAAPAVSARTGLQVLTPVRSAVSEMRGRLLGERRRRD